MYVRFCKVCGNKFVTKSSKRKYCSKGCADIIAKERRKKRDQLCWTCKNNDCLWSKYFLPVVGWDAKPTIVKDSEGDFSSYKISKCPEYIAG